MSRFLVDFELVPRSSYQGETQYHTCISTAVNEKVAGEFAFKRLKQMFPHHLVRITWVRIETKANLNDDIF